jgi:cell division protein FtsZ
VREKGALAIAFVTKPFSFEGAARIKLSEAQTSALSEAADVLVSIDSDRLMELAKDVPIGEAYKYADESFKNLVHIINEFIAPASLINLDSADILYALKDAKNIHFGRGRANGEGRVLAALEQACANTVTKTAAAGAKRCIFTVLGSPDLTLSEVGRAAEAVRGIVDKNAEIVFGVDIKDTLKSEVEVLVLAVI